MVECRTALLHAGEGSEGGADTQAAEEPDKAEVIRG